MNLDQRIDEILSAHYVPDVAGVARPGIKQLISEELKAARAVCDTSRDEHIIREYLDKRIAELGL